MNPYKESSVGTKKVCIIGGGVAGVGLWWTLAQAGQEVADWDITIIHDGADFGGHALTVPVQWNGGTTQVDTGVQFFIPLAYPNINCLVSLPEIKPQVPIAKYDSLKVACGFPRLNNTPQNWGNFPAYQTGANFAMYTPEMLSDAQRFQSFMDVALAPQWRDMTIDE